MRRFGAEVILVGLLAGVLAGCSGRGNAPIPPGAQVVHVVATESEVRLDPATVHAGDVYLVLDEPLDGAFQFIALIRTDAATTGSMSDDDLERLAHGDTEGILGPGWTMMETEPSVDPTAGPGGFLPPPTSTESTGRTLSSRSIRIVMRLR